MSKLSKLLAKSSKIRRNRRILLNIQITIIAWLVEVFAAVIAAIMMHAPYESNNREFYTAILEQITDLLYFIILPSIYLINSHDFKTTILDSKLYLAFTNKFFFNSVNKIVPAAGNDM